MKGTNDVVCSHCSHSAASGRMKGRKEQKRAMWGDRVHSLRSPVHPKQETELNAPRGEDAFVEMLSPEGKWRGINWAFLWNEEQKLTMLSLSPHRQHHEPTAPFAHPTSTFFTSSFGLWSLSHRSRRSCELSSHSRAPPRSVVCHLSPALSENRLLCHSLRIAPVRAGRTYTQVWHSSWPHEGQAVQMTIMLPHLQQWGA